MKLCEVQVSYKPNYSNANHPKINSTADINGLKWRLFDENTICHHEEFAVVYLNRANRVLGISRMFVGGTSSTPVDIKMIAQQAILCNASAVILAHNHPSGNTQPSSQDDEITRKTRAALQLFDTRLLDHVIMTAEETYSYLENGRI